MIEEEEEEEGPFVLPLAIPLVLVLVGGAMNARYKGVDGEGVGMWVRTRGTRGYLAEDGEGDNRNYTDLETIRS